MKYIIIFIKERSRNKITASYLKKIIDGKKQQCHSNILMKQLIPNHFSWVLTRSSEADTLIISAT